MRHPRRPHRLAPLALTIGVLLAALALPAGSPAAPVSQTGALTQLAGKSGCLVDRSVERKSGCGTARALKGPGAFMGSRAIAISPDGKHVYVASSDSNAIAIFSRDRKSGTLSQAKGSGGCVAVKGKGGCARAIGLVQPNSVAVSADGRNVYATSRASDSLTTFRRDPKTGALRQLSSSHHGCITGLAVPGCATGRALRAPDVVVVSPDGLNVYVGSFFGNSVAAFGRSPSNGSLGQLTGTDGCIAAATEGCATGIALNAVEGLAISENGLSVYAASALSNAVVELSRNASTGALAQATDGSGCIVDAALAGCTTGRELAGANAVAVSPGDGNVYVTSLLSNSVTAFDRNAGTGVLVQKEATNACLIFLRSAGCSFGRAMVAPEGLAVSPDGKNVYVAAFQTGAIDVLSRVKGGAVRQKQGPAGCMAARGVNGCTPSRALAGVSSVALSPDGRYLYSTALESDAVGIFKRQK